MLAFPDPMPEKDLLCIENSVHSTAVILVVTNRTED